MNVLQTLVDQAFEDASRDSPGGAEHVLLTDFLACVAGSDQGIAPRGWRKDGTAGCAAALGVRAHARDQDDVHWATGIHPGSVVWPVVLAVGSEVAADGVQAAVAARTGYNCMAALARLLGPAHARSWHATATCGGLGSAAAAAVLFGLKDEQRFWACSHAVAVAGGVGQALVEHSGTTGFHRVAGAVVGIQAARLAHAGVPASKAALDGERGVLALLGRAAAPIPAEMQLATLQTTSVRIYPINGLAQAAVAVTADLRQRARSDATSLVVEVSESVAAATTGVPGGQWWDLQGAVAAAWSTGDPFQLAATADSARLRDRVRVFSSACPGETRVTVQTAHGVLSEQVDSLPGLSTGDPRLIPLLERKWDLLVGSGNGGARRVWRASDAFLSEGPRPESLSEVLTL